MILASVIIIPATAFPSITAFVYLGGIMAPKLNTEVWAMALAIPMTTISTHISAKAASTCRVADKRGERASKAQITAKVGIILMFRENLLPFHMVRGWKIT
jgi:hypothetical protein